MASKRAHEDPGDQHTAVKRSRAEQSEFNGTVFRNMLKEPSRALKGLETFIRIARQLPCPDLYDVVEGYIKISAECSEMFRLLEDENHSEAEMMLILQGLEMVLLRTASDLSHLSMVGSNIAKKIVLSHMKFLLNSLHSENYRFVRQCLSFLSAVVSQGAEAARDVFSHIQFTKGLSALARKRDKTGKPDVRMAYIQFLLSFLMSGDNTTIGQILDTKDLLSEILTNGLKEDRLSTVNLILSTLQTRVVQNKAIRKTQKVRFFSASVLAQIASLYRWNGVVDVSTDDEEKEEDKEGGKRIVRELVHDFLLDLCCSRKHGISFHDPSLGTAGRSGNIVLLQFLVGLKQATEDEMVAELVVSVLKESPDILSRYFKETQFSFAPRIKSTWQENITLLKKILQAQPEVSTAFQTQEIIPLPRLLSMVLVTCLPSVCNKVFFTQGLNLPNLTVQHTTLSLLAFILRRAQKNIEFCLDKSVWETSDIFSTTMMEDFVQLFREALSKILPDMVSIVSKWQSLSKEKDDGTKTTNAEQKQEDKKKIEEFAGQDPQLTLVKALLLQVMCLYQKVVPHLVSQSKFDFSKLLKGIVTERGMKQEVPPVLQYQILQLALELPASKFSWFRVQDRADPDVEKGEKSVFYLLLKMFVSSNSNYLKTSTRMLVLKVLRDSGVFQHTWQELQFWLDHLAHLDSSQQEPVIQFLDHVLMKVLCNPHVYTEKAAGMIQEASYLQANLSGLEGDEASIPISHIDDVLDMVDVILEGSEGEIEEMGPSLTDDIILQTFPFSAIVPAVLEARNNLPATLTHHTGVVCGYTAAVLCDVLHCQRDPLALCLTLQHYDKELKASGSSPHASVVSLHRYYSQWLPQQTLQQLFVSESLSEGPPAEGLSALLKASYSEGPHALLQEAFRRSAEEAVAALDISQLPVAVNQVLLYLRTSVSSFNSLPRETAGELLSSLMALLNSLILKVLSPEDGAPLQPDGPQEDELFHTDLTPAQDIDREQTALAVLRSVFRHPAVEQWFLALELSSLPPHTLNPVRLKLLCARLTEGTLTLLQSSAATLAQLEASQLIHTYLTATERAVLRELQQKKSRPCPRGPSLSLRALLTLHPLLDPCSVRRLVSGLLLLPADGLVWAGQLSVYGRAVQTLLTHSSCLTLSQAHLQGLAALLTSCQCAALEDFLLQVLSQEPGSAKLIQPDVLLHCLQRDGPSARAIGALLLENCSTHLLSFQLWCLHKPNLSQLTCHSGSFLSVLHAYLQRSRDPCCPTDIQTSVLTALKKAFLSDLWRAVQEGDGLHVEVLSQLIRLTASPSDLTQLMSHLPAVLQKADSHERWKLADAISDVLAEGSDQRSHWRRSLLTAALHWLCAVYREQREPQVQQEEDMLKRLKSLMILPEDVSASHWNNFVKSGLKYRYLDPGFLGTLSTLLEVMYGAPEGPAELLPLATIHMMSTSHSLFLSTMLSTPDACDSLQSSKEALVSLLLTLVRKCPEVCSSSHLLVLLGAYGATLSTTDQKILFVLQEYEKNGISLTEYQYVLWGPAAVEHHKARRSLGPSLWQRPGSEQLLALLDPERMLKTVKHFPQQRHIIPQEGKELLYRAEGRGSLYDPCFLLPLFSFILRPECAVDCQKFVSCQALAVAMAALSSYDSRVRAAGYQVLGSFLQHLEGARFREKRQLLYLLNTVKNGIQKPNVRIPFLHVTYIAKVAQQILRPEEHMYVAMNRFLLGTQSLDLKRVPDFFRLFYSFDLEHRAEREWILSVLEEGLEDRCCYELCEKQNVYQTLLGLGSSALSDAACQIQIVNVLRQSARISRAAYDLTKSHGVLTWILQLIEKRYIDSKLLSCVIELLHSLWFTNLGNKESKAEDRPQTSGRCLPLPIISEFLCTLHTVLTHLGGVSAPQLKAFLHTLSSVLMHYGTALNAHQEAGWLTLHPPKPSCSEVLSLLQRWGTLARDASLLSALQTLTGQHRVKELLGCGRERGQGKGHSAKHARSQMERQAEAEDGGGNDLEKVVEDCKPLLRNIIIHWEPKHQQPSCAQPEAFSTNQPQSSDLDNATACLILKWALKTLTEGPYEDSSISAVLEWVRRVILPRADIVDAVLADEGTGQDLLRLYHHTCEHTAGEPGCSVETLQMFSAVMLHLLEAKRACMSDLHQTVLRTCLPSNAEDDVEKETGLKLLSLYIYELWSGARTPSLLLTHARLLCQTPRPPSHALLMCEHILSAGSSQQ